MDRYEQLLIESQFDASERQFLVNGFRNGFDIGYQGPATRCSESKNIPFTVGNHVEMWNKIMKEVKMKRVAGPFEKIPFENYIQSPVGLVPKSGGKTRLIFHLSYHFKDETQFRMQNNSVNGCMPREICTVKYNDLDAAVRACLETSELAMERNGNKIIFLGKTDLSSTFRVLCMNRKSFCWLVFKAIDPMDGKTKYFMDKCLPFGTSISCSHYQRFSNSLRHITRYRTGQKAINNYLDDFLFIAIAKWICNQMIAGFIKLCNELRIPIADEKTEWASTLLVFLGIMLDGKYQLLSIPLEKQERALKLLNDLTGKKKITVKQLQVIAGYLNFLTRAIFAGRTFNRRIYAKYAKVNAQLKPHYHIKVDDELRFDCEVWRFFLSHHRKVPVCRPMVDLDKIVTAEELFFYTDASGKFDCGIGAIFDKSWFFGQWEPGFIRDKEPSIDYLELIGLTAALLTWGEEIKNKRVLIYCNNQAVVAMVNKMTSTCKNCMYLLRLIVLNNLIHNRRVFVQYVKSADNELADALSRIQLLRFWSVAEKGT